MPYPNFPYVCDRLFLTHPRHHRRLGAVHSSSPLLLFTSWCFFSAPASVLHGLQTLRGVPVLACVAHRLPSLWGVPALVWVTHGYSPFRSDPLWHWTPPSKSTFPAVITTVHLQQSISKTISSTSSTSSSCPFLKYAWTGTPHTPLIGYSGGM